MVIFGINLEQFLKINEFNSRKINAFKKVNYLTGRERKRRSKTQIKNLG